MLNKVVRFLKGLRSIQRINTSLNRGAVGISTRSIDLTLSRFSKLERDLNLNLSFLI